MLRSVAPRCPALVLALGGWLAGTAPAAPPEHPRGTGPEATMFTASDGYERYMGRWSRRLATAYVVFAGVEDGSRLLDVGTGTGALSAALAAATTSGEIVGIDPSEAFIAAARRQARSPRERYEVGDAQALRFADASFDQALALLVMNFVPDHLRAVRELRRVTRPGGTVSACVWDYDSGMELLRVFWDEAVALDPAAKERDERNMKLCRKGQLGQLWREAGLEGVREEALVVDAAFTGFDDYWQPFLGGVGPGGAHVASLPAARRLQLEARLRKRLLGGRPDAPFTLKARAWCVRGQVPALP
jgi:SAM-dependent methyltransferase